MGSTAASTVTPALTTLLRLPTTKPTRPRRTEMLTSENGFSSQSPRVHKDHASHPHHQPGGEPLWLLVVLLELDQQLSPARRTLKTLISDGLTLLVQMLLVKPLIIREQTAMVTLPSETLLLLQLSLLPMLVRLSVFSEKAKPPCTITKPHSSGEKFLPVTPQPSCSVCSQINKPLLDLLLLLKRSQSPTRRSHGLPWIQQRHQLNQVDLPTLTQSGTTLPLS